MPVEPAATLFGVHSNARVTSIIAAAGIILVSHSLGYIVKTY